MVPLTILERKTSVEQTRDVSCTEASFYPSTGEVIAQTPCCTADEVDDAIAAASARMSHGR